MKNAWIPLAGALAVCGCSGEVGGATSVDLDNGASVTFRRSGLEITHGGRVLFAIAPDRAISATSYDETFTELWGFYAFDQTNFAERALERRTSVTREGDDVVIGYASTDGATTAVLRVSPEASDSTRLTLAITGGGPFDAVTVPMRCDDASSYFGFGAQTNALDQRGEAFPLMVTEQGIGREGLFLANGDQHTSYFPMPYFLDARGFGVVFDTDARVFVDLCNADPEVASVRVEHPGTLDVVLLHGPTPKSVVTQLGARYGRPIAPPSWVYEPWIGIQGGQAAVLAEADALDAAGVPWSVLWAQDWVGFLDLGGDFKDIQYHWNVDETLYPDLAGLTSTLHARDKRFLGYMNAFVEESREHYAPMDALGLLARTSTGESLLFPSFKGPTSLPDFTNPSTGPYVADFIEAMITTHGMDGWMADFGEWWPLRSVPFDGSDARLEHNRHPIRWQALHHETARGLLGNDYAIFTRSGWLGSQGTTQIVWLGDQEADFRPYDGLPTVIPLMLNLGLSAVPYTTHDIAGYSGGPSDKELWQRWTELGAFTPVMRTHEGLKAAANWRWDTDAETLAHFRRFARIHVALVPLFEALAAESAATSIPMVRPLLLEYPDEPEAHRIMDEYLLGTDLLVAPVVNEGETSREVYFPTGTWHHVLRANESYTGPGRFTVAAPIGEPPVFSRGAARTDLLAIQ